MPKLKPSGFPFGPHFVCALCKEPTNSVYGALLEPSTGNILTVHGPALTAPQLAASLLERGFKYTQVCDKCHGRPVDE